MIWCCAGENDGSRVGAYSNPKDPPAINDVFSHLGGKSKTPIKHETYSSSHLSCIDPWSNIKSPF